MQPSKPEKVVAFLSRNSWHGFKLFSPSTWLFNLHDILDGKNVLEETLGWETLKTTRSTCSCGAKLVFRALASKRVCIHCKKRWTHYVNHHECCNHCQRNCCRLAGMDGTFRTVVPDIKSDKDFLKEMGISG